MSATMQDAIAAARAGDKQQAQLLLSQYIQANPDDAQGWYLMSQLVDSKARRAAYLSKTLAINPWHERAWAEYYSLPPEVIHALESAQNLPVDQAADASQAVDWVAPAAAAVAISQVTENPSRVQRVTLNSEAVVVAETATGPVENQVVDINPAVPEAAAVAPASTPVPATLQPAPGSGTSSLTTLLIVLIIATLLVLAFLIYLLLQG